MAVTSVDGVNVLSGATAGYSRTGYVFDPGQEYEITGCRKTDSEVAAFTFTDSHNSYAERTGRHANVGVIGVAIFRERIPQPSYAPTPRGEHLSFNGIDPVRRVARHFCPDEPASAAKPSTMRGNRNWEHLKYSESHMTVSVNPALNYL